ncbi:MAG: integration host factor subunit beta [Holosporales bacterium]|jgi:integration host factor subunit beta|nr:integration host factor subunit beta [Holosporales bacterium]
MTRAELVTNLLKTYPNLPPSLTGAMVSHVLNAIAEGLIKGHRVEVRGFGAFSVRHRSPRKARNPKTGARVSVGPMKVIFFRAGKQLREWINEDFLANGPTY